MQENINASRTKKIIKTATRLQTNGNGASAIKLLLKYLKILPNDPATLYNLGLQYLLAGSSYEGMKLIAYRGHLLEFQPEPIKKFPITVWNGKPTKNKVVIWSSEGSGIGPEVMLFAFLTSITTKQANLLVTCEPRLLEAWQSSFPNINFVAYNDLTEQHVTDAQFHCSHFALPSIFMRYSARKDLATPENYLNYNKNECEYFKQKYKNLSNDKKIVGISWFSPNIRNGVNRSIPEADILEFIDEKRQFISLQHNYVGGLLKNSGKVYFDDEVNPLNLSRLINQIASMDLVICIDNSVAYIAAALNIPTYIIISDKKNWVWEVKKKNPSFFASVRIFELEGKCWKDLLAEVTLHINQNY